LKRAVLATGVAIAFATHFASQPARAGDKMPPLKMNRDYIYQCDDEPGGKCSAAELAAIRRNVERAWDKATDSAREACAPAKTYRGMSICLSRVMVGAAPDLDFYDPGHGD
jgi:hypothetical protein